MNKSRIILAKCERCLWRGWWLKTADGVRSYGVSKPGACPDCGSRLTVSECGEPAAKTWRPAALTGDA